MPSSLRLVASPRPPEAPAHYAGNDGLDAGATLRCWILPWGEHCGFDPLRQFGKAGGFVKRGIRWNDSNYRQRTAAPGGLHGLEPLGQNGAGRFPSFEHRS